MSDFGAMVHACPRCGVEVGGFHAPRNGCLVPRLCDNDDTPREVRFATEPMTARAAALLRGVLPSPPFTRGGYVHRNALFPSVATRAMFVENERRRTEETGPNATGIYDFTFAAVDGSDRLHMVSVRAHRFSSAPPDGHRCNCGQTLPDHDVSPGWACRCHGDGTSAFLDHIDEDVRRGTSTVYAPVATTKPKAAVCDNCRVNPETSGGGPFCDPCRRKLAWLGSDDPNAMLHDMGLDTRLKEGDRLYTRATFAIIKRVADPWLSDGVADLAVMYPTSRATWAAIEERVRTKRQTTGSYLLEHAIGVARFIEADYREARLTSKWADVAAWRWEIIREADRAICDVMRRELPGPA